MSWLNPLAWGRSNTPSPTNLQQTETSCLTTDSQAGTVYTTVKKLTVLAAGVFFVPQLLPRVNPVTVLPRLLWKAGKMYQADRKEKQDLKEENQRLKKQVEVGSEAFKAETTHSKILHEEVKFLRSEKEIIIQERDAVGEKLQTVEKKLDAAYSENKVILQERDAVGEKLQVVEKKLDTAYSENKVIIQELDLVGEKLKEETKKSQKLEKNLGTTRNGLGGAALLGGTILVNAIAEGLKKK